jgi:ribonuclease J
MEGTNIRPDESPAADQQTESEVEQAMVQTMKATKAMVLAVFSTQNIDRLVTVYRAALQADRDLVIDLYTASIAKATGNENIPHAGPDWPRVRVFIPVAAGQGEKRRRVPSGGGGPAVTGLCELAGR